MKNSTHLSDATIRDYLKSAGIPYESVSEVFMDGWTLRISYAADSGFESLHPLPEKNQAKGSNNRVVFHTREREKKKFRR